MKGLTVLAGTLAGTRRGWRPRLFRALVLLIVGPSSPPPATPQADGEGITLGHYRVLHSEVLGEDRILQVHLPSGYQEADLAYPVVYLFYSNWVEGYFSQAVNDLYHLGMDRMPPSILVGIPNTQRYRDLYPWVSAGGRGGGADRFLTFLREELIPFVDREYRTKPYRIMVGPQAASVFGAYTLLEAPGTFQALILNDPCRLDTPDRALCPGILEFSRSGETRGVYFAVSHDAGESRWDGSGLRALEAGFREGVADGFRWRIETVEEWPFFLAPVEVRSALLDLFRGYPFEAQGDARGLADVEAHYRAVSDEYGFEVDPPPLVLSLVAAHLAERGDYQPALEILNRLVALHPSSLDGPWQLANLHRVMGDTATAIRYFEECLRRDPSITPARDWLERLRKD